MSDGPEPPIAAPRAARLSGAAAEPLLIPRSGFDRGRVQAMVLRHVYTLRKSWPRILELAYWPTIQMVIWGFISVHFAGHSDWVVRAAGVLISAALLWDVLFRANLGVSLCFLEEMYSRNLGQLFVSPLRPSEFIVAMLCMSAIRTVISVTPAALLAMPFFDVWVFDLGPPLAAFFANLLVMGACVGLLMASLVLRFGLGAESLAWLGVFLMAPISAIYYPVDVLPVWLRHIALCFPGAHVFEGMRAVLFEGVFRWDHFACACGLNLLYLTAAGLFFLRMIRVAKVKGLLLDQGE